MKQFDRFHTRGAAMIAALASIAVFFLSYRMILSTGLIPGANEEIDLLSDQIFEKIRQGETVEGQFIDRLGEFITEVPEGERFAEVLYDECYSHLIGYSSDRYKVSGLRKTLLDDLFDGGKDSVGATVQLTTDNELQEYCYELIDANEGSLIVMNADTGALLACASRSHPEIGYNVNKINEMYDTYNSCDAFFLNRATMAQDPPGSTFKIVTAASLIENGLDDFLYDDRGTCEVDGTIIQNYAAIGYGKDVDLEKAMNYSVNTYFVNAALKLRASKLRSTAKDFMLGSTIELDFATLNSNFKVGMDKFKLASAAFGQGETVMSPLHVAMMMGAVLNDGTIMKPYLVEAVANDGKIVRRTEPAALNRAFSEETAKELRRILHSTAEVYKLTEEEYGMVYAKTGTAEVQNGEKLHLYYLAGVETESGNYVVLADRWNTDKNSTDLKEPVAAVIDWLRTME